MAKSLKFIAAIDEELGLARENKIPWDLPTDRQFFRDSIKSGIGLMGWNTFESNGKRPFKTSSRNVVITNRNEVFEGVEIIHDLRSFIDKTDEDIWVIGGGDVFRQLLPIATHLYLTRVSGTYDCDVFFPAFEDTFKRTKVLHENTENDIAYRIEIWQPTQG